MSPILPRTYPLVNTASKTVSGMLGHYSAGFTLDTYAHVTTQAQRQAADTMANILADAI